MLVVGWKSCFRLSDEKRRKNETGYLRGFPAYEALEGDTHLIEEIGSHGRPIRILIGKCSTIRLVCFWMKIEWVSGTIK